MIDSCGNKMTQFPVFVPTWDNEPPEVPALLSFNKSPVLSPDNISLMLGGAGTGKSGIIEGQCAAAIDPMVDAFGFEVHAASVLYIDTERSKYHHHRSWQRFNRRASLEKTSPISHAVKFELISMIETMEDRLNYLWQTIDNSDPPKLVLIDGIGDFVLDVNCTEEVVPFVSRLCSVVKLRNIGILVTLHGNPRDHEKARGVLGSELWRKAESVILVQRVPNSDCREITTEFSLGKVRAGCDKLSSYYRWSDDLKMFVSASEPSKPQGAKAAKQAEIKKMFISQPVWTYMKLADAIVNLTGYKLRTAKERISDAIEMGEIVKNPDGTYSPLVQDSGQIQPHWSEK